jgi:predicted transcriptional regulator
MTPMKDTRADNPRAPQLIVGRLMREFAVWWPKSLQLQDREESQVVLDLSQSSVWQSRIAVSAENAEIAVKASAWLTQAGMIEYTQNNDHRIMELTKAGLDCLHSLDAFRRYRGAKTSAEREGITEALDRELSEYLGPRFVTWLAANHTPKS